MAVNKNIPPFIAPCSTLFLVEGHQVRILGDDGSEAVVPLQDLAAFLEHLAEKLASQPSGPAELSNAGDT